MAATTHVTSEHAPGGVGRVDWVDIAKGICIILVVLMHSTLGVEKQTGTTGYVHSFIDWAHPFRMPDFFLISGLFLAARIDRPWGEYLDTKVLHFAYFYVIWFNIQFLLRASGLLAELGPAGTALFYFGSYLQPFGTLWFIFQLPVFFVAAKFLNKEHPALVWVAAVVIYLAAPHTGSIVIDEFCQRFVYFFTGYIGASYVMGFADRVRNVPVLWLLPALAVWAFWNALAVSSGVAKLPGIDLLLGFVGIAAVVTMSVILANSFAGPAMSYLGLHSIAVYLAFTVFMAPVRMVLLKYAGPAWVDPISVAVACSSIAGALLLRALVARTPLRFLFVRPSWLGLKPAKIKGLAPAVAAVDAATPDRPPLGPQSRIRGRSTADLRASG